MVTLPMRAAVNKDGKHLHINSCGFIATNVGMHCMFCAAMRHDADDWRQLYVIDTALVNEWNALVGELPADLHKFKIAA